MGCHTSHRLNLGGVFIANLKRNILLNFRVTEAERELIAEKMTAAGIRNKEAYLRKMVLDGYVVHLDFSDVRQMVRLLSNATSNLNQIAKRANETRSVFADDIKDLQEDYEKLWGFAEGALKKLASI